MNKIKPTHVTFQQAKKLKEKGFNHHDVYEDVADYYDYYDPTVQGRCHYSDFKEGLPNKNWIPVPEQWQVIEWLRVNHGIWVEVMLIKGYKYTFQCYNETLTEFGAERIGEENTKDFNSPQEAYSAAFDYILNNNLI